MDEVFDGCADHGLNLAEIVHVGLLFQINVPDQISSSKPVKIIWFGKKLFSSTEFFWVCQLNLHSPARLHPPKVKGQRTKKEKSAGFYSGEVFRGNTFNHAYKIGHSHIRSHCFCMVTRDLWSH